MKNLPEGMIADKDNQVFYDTEKNQFYMISWEDIGTYDLPTRHYIEISHAEFPYNKIKIKLESNE